MSTTFKSKSDQISNDCMAEIRRAAETFESKQTAIWDEYSLAVHHAIKVRNLATEKALAEEMR